jgi:CRP/FNR family cyclic AMP-dependent transcriptional regulator
MDVDLLKKIPLFAKLSDEKVTAAAKLLRREEVPANRPIFYIGEHGSSFMILASGRVAITQPDEDGKEMVINTAGPGSFFGELSLLDGGPRTATVRTMSDAVVLTLGREDFLQFVRAHPDFAIHLMEEMGRRQRSMLGMLRGVKNANQEMEERLTLGQRLAAVVSSAMGSWTLVIGQSVLGVLWVVVNVVVSAAQQWDPYPFALLGLVETTIAWYAASIIMMAQARQSEKDRIRADLEYQVNVKAHHEVMRLHQKLDGISKRLEQGPNAEAEGQP